MGFFYDSAKLGNSMGYSNLAYCLFNGDGVERDQELAIGLFKRALQINPENTYALSNLGFAYRLGKGVKKNISRYIEMILTRIELGDIDAINLIGILYDKGEFLPKNAQRSFQWTLKAAEFGHVLAQYNLAMCYQFGDGTEIDVQKAVQWFESAG